MGDRLIFFLLGLSGRERVLLALLGAVVLPVGLWLGLVQPLLGARDTARTALAEALIAREWIDARVQESGRLAQIGPGAGAAPIGIAGLERSLIEAGLREAVSELTRRGDDEIELRFDAVGFTRLGDWLGRVSPGWGYAISGLRIERGAEPGLVSARFSLSPRP